MPNGYKIRGIEPPDLKDRSDAEKLMYWGWVVDLGLRAKDAELARGLDKAGKPLRPIKASTRKHRRSAMTASGRGDPYAPPLMPGRGLSRTRSLLTGRAYTTHAAFWWRYDPWTGDTWNRILTYQARKGRDVFGLSPEATSRVQRQALALWNRYVRTGSGVIDRQVAALKPTALIRIPNGPAIPNRNVQRIDPYRFATFGIGADEQQIRSARGGHGGMTRDQLERFARSAARANVRGRKRPGGWWNRLLSWVWGNG